MRVRVFVAPLVLFLAACTMTTDKLAEPGPGAGKPAPKKQTLIVTDADEGKNQGKSCELKNPAGTGACDDGRQAGAAAKPAAAKASAKPASMQFEPWMCEQGASAMGPVWGAMLSGNLKNLQNYCLAIEGGAAPAPAQQAAVTDDGDRGGTWYCDDKADGAGNYGTWEMTQMTDRYYNCYRAD